MASVQLLMHRSSVTLNGFPNKTLLCIVAFVSFVPQKAACTLIPLHPPIMHMFLLILIKLIPNLQPYQHEHSLEYNLVSDPYLLCLVRMILSITAVNVLMTRGGSRNLGGHKLAICYVYHCSLQMVGVVYSC